MPNQIPYVDLEPLQPDPSVRRMRTKLEESHYKIKNRKKKCYTVFITVPSHSTLGLFHLEKRNIDIYSLVTLMRTMRLNQALLLLEPEALVVKVRSLCDQQIQFEMEPL